MSAQYRLHPVGHRGVAYGPEVTTHKTYYAKGTRIAVREDGELHWLFGDHPSASSGQA